MRIPCYVCAQSFSTVVYEACGPVFIDASLPDFDGAIHLTNNAGDLTGVTIGTSFATYYVGTGVQPLQGFRLI